LQRRLVEGIRIEFVAKQRLAFPGEDGIWEDDEVFRKEVFLGPAKGGDTSSKGKGKSEGLWLEKGINVSPSSRDRTGRVRTSFA
jgi:hypothetical protein